MHHIIFKSCSSKFMSAQEIGALIESMRISNARFDITGALFYGEDGQIMQVLEGPEKSVALLYAQILHDPRHTHVIKIVDKPIIGRVFDGEPMAFRHIKSHDFARLMSRVDPDQLDLHVANLYVDDEALLLLMKTFTRQ